MELKPGYKQTEVGVIPVGWDAKRLGDLLNLISGYAFSSDFFSDNGPILLTPGNFKLEGGLYFNEKNTKRYSGDYSASMKFSKGDLLIVMTDLTPECNLLGKPAFVDSDEIVLHNQRIGKVALREKCIDVNYLFYIFLSEPYLTRIREMATGSTVRHTSNKSIYSIHIPVPSIPEQRAIAAALGDVDALINALDRLIAKKRGIKPAAMQELLTGKKRLPGYSGEWEVKRLGDVFSVTAGGDFDPSQSSPTQDETYCYPIYSNAISERGLYGYCSYSDHEADSITVTARGTLGIANYRDHKFTAIGRVLVLKPKEPSDGRFFSEFINHGIDFVVESTGVPQLTTPQISKYELPVPSRSEQTAIAAVLSDMDAEIAALEQKRDKTRALKQGMMQELLTGKTRLV